VSRLRVVTANLLHGQALDGTVSESALRTAVDDLGADLLAIQEVDRFQPRSGGVDQTAVAAQAGGFVASRFVPAVFGTPGPGGTWRPAQVEDGALTDGPTYGLALLSRWPVRAWHVLRFPPSRVGLPLKVAGRAGLVVVPDEPRTALAAIVEGPEGLLTVATAHLSFVPGRNVVQLRRIAQWLRRYPGPHILLGDLNLPGAVPSRTMGWHDLARTPTYPSWRPKIQWDHVLVDGETAPAVLDSAAVDLSFSDHLALRVDLEPAAWTAGAREVRRVMRRERSGPARPGRPRRAGRPVR